MSVTRDTAHLERSQLKIRARKNAVSIIQLTKMHKEKKIIKEKKYKKCQRLLFTIT